MFTGAFTHKHRPRAVGYIHGPVCIDKFLKIGVDSKFATAYEGLTDGGPSTFRCIINLLNEKLHYNFRWLYQIIIIFPFGENDFKFYPKPICLFQIFSTAKGQFNRIPGSIFNTGGQLTRQGGA